MLPFLSVSRPASINYYALTRKSTYACYAAKNPPTKKRNDLPELNERSPLHGTVDLTHVAQAEVDQFLVLFLPQPAHETRTFEQLPHPIGDQSILGEAEVEQARHVHGGRTKLLLLFDQIGPAHEANGALVAESGQQC